MNNNHMCLNWIETKGGQLSSPLPYMHPHWDRNFFATQLSNTKTLDTLFCFVS